MQPLSEIFPIVTGEKIRAGIVMHQKPDADAMGSSLALSTFLRALGHETVVVSPTNWANFLAWMPGAGEVFDYEKFTAKTEAALQSCQYIFCLDYNHFGRTRRMMPFLTGLNIPKILIDHHQEPQTEAFAYGRSDTGKSSTSEMVYDFIMEMGQAHLLNDTIAQCLYAGVMTDTGSFRFPSTTPSVHRMVAHLMELGLNHSAIHDELFDNFLENRLRFLGHVLCNRMEIFYEYNTSLIAVPFSDLRKFDIKTGDTEGIVNLQQTITGLKMAAIIIDRGDEVKLSFRSKGNVDVNTFARKYFEGGGHFHAAGGGSKTGLEDTVARFKKALAENIDILQ
ncbi:MAG: DHH family phosphoesterase [Dinghuibacter sp.]|nr:DHH family phosphoesterase [Dinghuibacter sp.]